MKSDFHIHSINSGHAYGTIYEIAKQAEEKGLLVIAITDHGPSYIGTTGGFVHFNMSNRNPKYIDGVRVLWGAELNLINFDGNIDLEEKILKNLDFVLLGLHDRTPYQDAGKEKNTMAFLKAMDNPYIQAIAHPVNPSFEYDEIQVIKKAIDKGLYLEFNLGWFLKTCETHFDKHKLLVDMVKKYHGKLIISSDAHFLHEIGDDSILKKYEKKLEIDPKIIFNSFLEEKYLTENND